jgi:hypothetical protein
MTKTNNPLIDPPNYWAEYQQSIDKQNENNPEILELSKLCFETFETAPGKQLMVKLERDYLIPNLAQVGTPGYADLSVYFNGFKAALLMLRSAHNQHQRRISQSKEKA